MTAADADAIRQKGNDFYRSGKLTEAILFYERAAQLSPNDAAPHSNLSAAFFELGEYGKAIEHCDSGLALATDQAAKQKLRMRKAKCCIYLKDFEGATDALGEAAQSGEAAELANSARHLKSRPLDRRRACIYTLRQDPHKSRSAPVRSIEDPPFVAELSSLLGIWGPALPFGVPSANIPLPGIVSRYSFTLETIPDDPVAEPPAFVLVLLRRSLSFKIHFDLRSYLLGDEKADKSDLAEEVRERGMHVKSTWTWDRRDRSGSFWLRQDLLEEMRKGDWEFGIRRSDAWAPQTPQMSLAILRDCGPF